MTDLLVGLFILWICSLGDNDAKKKDEEDHIVVLFDMNNEDFDSD